MNFREFAEKNTVILDGAMGTMLDKRGILPGELPETWNITHPDVISDIHRAYFDAGANVVNTNTFGANVLKYSSDELKKIIESAVICAKRALAESSGTQDKFIALDVGPLGKLIAPFGELTFDEAYRAFYETVKCGIACGVDLITLETMNDSLECKAALLAARELCQLPIIVTNVYGEDGKLMTGATPEVMAAMLEGLGADYIGANCSQGPDALLPVAERLISELSVPCVLKPNAGLPRVVSGRTVYDVSAEDFARGLVRATELGVRFIGGCCGTTPEYIACLSKMLNSKKPLPIERKNKTVITSFCRAHTFDGAFTVIGESLNPTGKKRMKEAVRSHDIDYIVNIGVSEEECGADALDVNVGLPDISERDFLPKVISALQYATSCPLVIDTSDVSALENALRIYNGKAMINSVNGKPESMRAVFPLQKKYGGVVIALTLDEKG
ncbi:MAG: homocysteine S-methyltransferase family protein, partial [Clostridia bacterium]|nr:homocysteine S-methyltransferase family protein [Clostridia bacterium]